MWCAHCVKCQLCGNKQVSVWESEDGIVPDDLTCGNCGGYSCEADPEAMAEAESKIAVQKLLDKFNIHTE